MPTAMIPIAPAHDTCSSPTLGGRVRMSPTPDRWRSLEELFHAALDLPADRRAAFLKDACPDESLRREVQALFWSNNGRELFYETPDYRIMVVDYTVCGNSFGPGKPRLWCGKQILYTGGTPNLDLAPDGRRFVVFAPVDAGKKPVHVTMLFNFFDELRRRLPVAGK
jgi:hypothetical protein